MTDDDPQWPTVRSQRRRRGAAHPGERPAVGAAACPEADGGEAPAEGTLGAEIGAALESDHEKVARQVALRLLTSAPRSRAQLAEAMAKKDVPSDVAERVLDRFTDVGLIDDAEYAAILVRTRHVERGQARRAIAQELARKGIDPETAASALSVVDRDDEDAAALDLVRRRAGATVGLARDTRVRRLVGMLARKGHPPGAAFRIVTTVLDAEAERDEAQRDEAEE